MNDESLSADNDVGLRCKQSDGSRRRLNHYVSYTQPHPSILMRAPAARPTVSSAFTPSLAAALTCAPRVFAGNEIIPLMHAASCLRCRSSKSYEQATASYSTSLYARFSYVSQSIITINSSMLEEQKTL